MRKSIALGAAALCVLIAAGIAMAATVYPGNEDSWSGATYSCDASPTTATQGFVNGPGTPPAGTGSRQMTVGANGNSEADYTNSAYAGTSLTSLSLSYSTYVQDPRTGLVGNTGQAPYIILGVDYTGDDTWDDLLFFEPAYQNGTYSGDPVPNQGNVAYNTWQSWNASAGGWWSLNAGTFGPPLVTLSSYAAAHPGAKIVNFGTGPGDGGISVSVGCGAGSWDNFVGYVDKVTINGTTYDFELTPPIVVATSKDQCKNDGWKTVKRANGSSFKNQGDCIQYVNTGK